MTTIDEASNTTFSDIDEDKLYEELKTLPDFLNLPLPARWFKKYNIPPIESEPIREFIKSNYTFNCMFAPKDLPAIIINEPQRDTSGNIKLVKYVEEEPIKVDVISRPYDPDAPPIDVSHLLETKTTDQCEQSAEVLLEQPSLEQDQPSS